MTTSKPTDSTSTPAPAETPMPLRTGRRRYNTAMMDALELQRTIMQRVRNPAIKSSVLAALARAWCDVEERKRILRGVPLPGMLRPTDDPVKMAKRLRESRNYAPQFVELSERAGPSNSPVVEESKESLLPKEG